MSKTQNLIIYQFKIYTLFINSIYTYTSPDASDVCSHVVGSSTEDLHEDVFISARPFHGFPQLLDGIDDGRVQHGENGLLKVP